MAPPLHRLKGSPTAWIAVGLSVMGMTFGTLNRIRTEDIADLQGQLLRQREEIQGQLRQQEREIGELRQDVRELRQIMLDRRER